jgi:hypothetical protein
VNLPYGDCGYGITEEPWHHGPGYLPVRLPPDVPGERCER